MVFVLPPKAQVGVLDPEIAGEGAKIIYSDGEQMTFNPPPPRPVMPDWSQIKSIARYFNRTGHQVWPAWLYHPTEEPRLVKNQDEAAQLGVCYREASLDEKGRYGRSQVWDWTDDSKWRPQPHGPAKFDPLKLGQGKNYIATPANPAVAQNALLEALIPTVTAAVVSALKSTGPSAPANIDATQWEAFLQFQAWQKTKEVVDQVAEEIDRPQDGTLDLGGDGDDTLNALTADQERLLWEEEAKRKGVKSDRRWSLERLKTEVEKAA